MSASDDYPWASHGHVQYLLAEIDRLRAELTVANNRLGNAVGALIDAGTYCAGPDDVTAGIDRLRAENEMLRNGDEAWRVVLPKIAAERASWEAIRQAVNCPTCDGSGVETDDSMAVVGVPGGQYPVGPCPDCTDGKIDMARLLAVGAAAVAALAKRNAAYQARENGDMANWRAMDAIETALRQVRP